MKKTTLFSLLAMMFLCVSSNVWAADEPFYTLFTVPFATGSNHTSYSDYFDDVHDGMTWNAPGNQSLEGKWRIGGKSLDGVDRTITAKTPMGSEIDRVVVNHLGVSKASFVVNSMTLTVASDVEYTTVIDEVVLTPAFEQGVEGSVEFLPSIGTPWPTDAYYRLTINVTNPNASNAGLDLTSIEFFAPGGGSGTTVEKPVIEPNGGTFSEPVTVTITAGEDCQIYYTTDGTDPEMTHGLYTEPFTVSETCTVKAIAYDVTGAPSSIASATFNFPSVITSIAELCAADKGEVTVQFVGWTVTGVKGKNAYFSDGVNGILLYEDGHGFEVGDQLRGQATFNLTEYKGAPEITGLKATTEGVVVAGKGIELSPIETTIGALQTNMQGCVIKLTDLTYSEGVFKDATGAEIIPYNTFSITMPTLEDGKVYDATGIAVYFDKWEIAPRTSDDFVEAGTIVNVAKPVITPNGGTFTEPQEVTITAEEGCIIIYTTDGTDPSFAAGSQYTGPFTVSETCTVKAIAVDVTGEPSSIASAEFTFISATAVPSIARLCPLAPAEGEVEVLVDFNNWIVTGVKGGQVYFTDGPNGIVLYQKDHGFNLGDKVTGRAVVKLTTYNECAEILGLKATTEGISVEADATPETIALNELNSLSQDKQGCLLRLEEVTYDAESGLFIDSDDNSIAPMTNKFVALPELIDGKTYNVTGVAIWYIPTGEAGTWMIAPRSTDELELITSQEAPISSWSVEEEVVDINGEVTAVFTTNSDGAVSYTSSDESVAIIDAAGLIRPVGRGVTTITANVAETENFLPDSKSFTLTVKKDGYVDITFAYDDEDITGQGAPEVGGELTATRNDIVTLYANRAYAKTGDTHIKVYGTNDNGDSFVQLSVADGYAITQIVMTATGESNIKAWKDQFGAEVAVYGETATWQGLQNCVIMTNQERGQARLKTISVAIMKLEDTGKTVTIGECGRTTFCSDVKVVVSGVAQFAVASVVTSANGPVLVTDDLGTVVPANTGVLLTGAPGEYKVYTQPDLEESYPTANYLMGVLEEVAAPFGSYVLQEDGPMAFFKFVDETIVNVPAGKAYLSLPGTSLQNLFFTEEDYETGINLVEANVSDAIYNLAGQRLSKMQKGINVVGGKKILK